MIREEERDCLIESLREKHLANPGKLWDEVVNADSLGLIGLEVDAAMDQRASKARRGLTLVGIIEARLAEAAQRLAEEEADAELSKPRSRGNRMPMGPKEKEDAEDLS